MRAAPLIAGGLVVAAAGLAGVAFTSEESERAATPAARDGLAVWTEQGCGSCHTFAAASSTGTLGPDLTQNLRGMPAASIRESIVAPSNAAAAGYSVGMMPEDYAGRIPPEDLAELVRFLRD